MYKKLSDWQIAYKKLSFWHIKYKKPSLLGIINLETIVKASILIIDALSVYEVVHIYLYLSMNSKACIQQAFIVTVTIEAVVTLEIIIDK